MTWSKNHLEPDKKLYAFTENYWIIEFKILYQDVSFLLCFGPISDSYSVFLFTIIFHAVDRNGVKITETFNKGANFAMKDKLRKAKVSMSILQVEFHFLMFYVNL